MSIANRIKTSVRQIDTAARDGGDEFAVILPTTSLNDATVVAERILISVSETPVCYGQTNIAVSISVGVGQYDSHVSPENITSCSDQALYKAKLAGKNTIRIYE